MVRNPLIPKRPKPLKKFQENKSAGILDDFAVRKNIATRAGTIQKTPVNDSDILNKKFGDDTYGKLDSPNTWTALNIHEEDIRLNDNKKLGLGTGSQGDDGDCCFSHDGTNLTLKRCAGVGNTFDNFFIEDANVGGTKIAFNLNNNTGGTAAGFTTIWLMSGDVLMTSTKGLEMTRAGSVVGLSINYDVTGTAGTPNPSLRVLKNGTNVFQLSLDNTVATDKTASTTQDRGIDTFVAGDCLSVTIKDGGLLSSYTVDKIIVTLEIVYDT